MSILTFPDMCKQYENLFFVKFFNRKLGTFYKH